MDTELTLVTNPGIDMPMLQRDPSMHSLHDYEPSQLQALGITTP